MQRQFKKKYQQKNDCNNRLTLHLLRRTDFHRFASASLRAIKTPEESVIEKIKLKSPYRETKF